MVTRSDDMGAESPENCDLYPKYLEELFLPYRAISILVQAQRIEPCIKKMRARSGGVYETTISYSFMKMVRQRVLSGMSVFSLCHLINVTNAPIVAS